LLAPLAAAEILEIWPENWKSWRLFCQVSSQWRTGMGGATGLCYEAVYPLIDRAADNPDEWDDLFEDVATMERAALTAMHET